MRIFTEQDLKPFQRIGVDFLCSRTAAYLGDEMRLGKTVQSICAANRLRARKILVCCPATVKLQWAEEFNRWGDRSRVCDVIFGSRGKINDIAHVIIINYDLLIYKGIFDQLRKMRFDVGIFDEAHFLQGRKSKRTKTVLLKGGIASACARWWFLSGTPILNRPVELFPILAAVSPKTIAPYNTYEKYTKRFCGAYWDGIQWYDKGSTHREDLNFRLNSGFMLRRTRKDVDDQMPEPETELVPIPAGGKLGQLVAQELKWTTKEAKYQSFAEEEESISRVRHEIALGKVDTAIRHLKYLFTITDKIVVFAYHRDVLKALFNGLSKYNPVMVHGGTNTIKREEKRVRFQTDSNTRIFIGQYVAAGVGIDLSAASTILFVESSWVPGEIEQAMARCDNLAKTEKVLVQFLVVQDSVEEHMLRTVIDKKRKIKETIEDDDDIAYMFT